MKLKNYTLLFYLFLIVNINAQEKLQINLLGSGIANNVGLNTQNKESIDITIPKGNHRILMVYIYIERKHNTPSTNFPSPVENYPNVHVKPWDVYLRGDGVNQLMYSNGRSSTSVSFGYATDPYYQFSNESYLSQHYGSFMLNLDSSTEDKSFTLDYSSISKINMTSDDELVVSYVIYDNVSSLSRSTNTSGNGRAQPLSGSLFRSVQGNMTSIQHALNRANPTLGRDANEVIYTSNVYSARSDDYMFTNLATLIQRSVVVNNGQSNSIANPSFQTNENDGIGVVIQDFNRIGAKLPNNTSINLTHNVNPSNYKVSSYFTTGNSLLPLAMPSYSGNIYNDIDGNVNINGNSVNGSPTGGNPLFINVIDSKGSLLTSVQVANNGSFSIPVGVVTETYKYNLILTNSPTSTIPVLNSGWYTVGEATGSSGNDGNANGIIEITVGTTNVTGLRYGISTNQNYCFKLPVIDSNRKLNTNVGVTSLQRNVSVNDQFPYAKQSAWLVLEARTKGFVVNRVGFNSSGNPIGIPVINYVEGMMVYDTTNNCLKIYNGTIWSCFTTPACPQ